MTENAATDGGPRPSARDTLALALAASAMAVAIAALVVAVRDDHQDPRRYEMVATEHWPYVLDTVDG